MNGAKEIGVRASIWSSDFIVGAGAPGGVRLPWANTIESWGMSVERNVSANDASSLFFIVQLAVEPSS